MATNLPLPLESYKRGNAGGLGRCLILNNLTTDSDDDIKQGSKKDASLILTTFAKLGFSPALEEPRHVKDVERYKEYMKKAYDEEEHEGKDCLVVFILSHGDEGGKITLDGVSIPIEDLKRPLRDVKTLHGKPKIFFILACRGENSMGVLGTKRGIVVEADFLTYYSTVEGYESLIDEQGSTFVKELCKSIHTFSSHYDLVSILTYVNDRVQGSDKEGEKMMPCITSTLRKLVYFTSSTSAGGPGILQKRELEQDVTDGRSSLKKTSSATPEPVDKLKFMTDTHKKKLREKRSFLVDNMKNPLIIAEDLFSATVLLESEYDKVQAKTTRRDQAAELMGIISLKSDFAFDALVDALAKKEDHTCSQALE